MPNKKIIAHKKNTSSPDKNELPVISFKGQKEWNKWLDKNHRGSNGIWIRFFKKDSGEQSVNHDKALEEAICYGWIDGQLKKYDEASYLQKFTPRRPKSIWSKKNIRHAERLIKEKRMKEAGLAEIEKAKADGRWEKAYDAQSEMKIPADFMKELSKNKKAAAFFKTLNRTNLYSIGWKLQTAKKPETRARRMHAIIEKLEKGEKFH